MFRSRLTLHVVASFFACGLVALSSSRARADFFSAPVDSATGGRQICAVDGAICLSAPTIDTPRGGGVRIQGAPTLTFAPRGGPRFSIQLGEAEVTITPTGMRFMGSAGFSGFGPMQGWEFTGPHGDLALGLGSSAAFDGYESNGNPPGFPVGDTRIAKDDRWVYLYISYGAEFTVSAPGGVLSATQELISGNTLLIGMNPSAPENFAFYLGGGFTAPLTYGVVGEGYILIQNGATASSLAPLGVRYEFPGDRTLPGTLSPSLLIGGTVQLGSPSIPISGHTQMAMQLDAARLSDTRGRLDASLTLDLDQYPPFSASIPLSQAGAYASGQHTLVKCGNLPPSIFAGTPLEDFDVGTGGYSFDAYIPYRASPVIQFRAETARILGMRFGSLKIAFLDGGLVAVRANLDVFGATYQMVGSITTGPNPRLRLTNVGALDLFGQSLAQGQLEVIITRDDAVLHVSGGVVLSGVRFTLDRTFSAAELASQAAGLSIPLPPVAFRQNLTTEIGGRTFGIRFSGSASGVLSRSPSVTASGSAGIRADSIHVEVPPICTPRVCTPGACTPRTCTPGACTPRTCTPGACTPRICGPLGCTPRHCEPEHCVPRHCEPERCVERSCAPETCEPAHCTPQAPIDTPAVDESAAFRNVTVTPNGFSVAVPRAGNRNAQPTYDDPPPPPAPRAEAAITPPPAGPTETRTVTLGPPIVRTTTTTTTTTTTPVDPRRTTTTTTTTTPPPVDPGRTTTTTTTTPPPVDPGRTTTTTTTTTPPVDPGRTTTTTTTTTTPVDPGRTTTTTTTVPTRPVDACAAQTTCGACTAQGACGWCDGRCATGTGRGPRAGACSSTTWAWYGNQCTAPSVPTPTPTDACSAFASCDSCTAQGACGWCDGRCASGTGRGPSSGACSSTTWAWFGNQCTAASVPTPTPTDACSGFTSCDSCTAQGACGWCDGRCASGTGRGPSSGACASTTWAWFGNQCVAPVPPTSTPVVVPQTQTTSADGPRWRLTNSWRGPDICFESLPGRTGAGSVALRSCSTSTGQVWVAVADPSGAVRLTTLQDGAAMCLDLIDGSNRLALAACGARPGQLWHLVPSGGDTFRLTSDAGGPNRCLDVINDGTNDQVQLVPCANYSGQFWLTPSVPR